MKKRLLQLSGWLISFLPLGIYVGLNFDNYSPDVVETVKLGIGGTSVAVITILMALGKMNIPKGVTGLVIALAIAWLMQAIIADLVTLLFFATTGRLGDVILIQPQVKRIAKKKDTNDLAEAITSKMEEKKGTRRV